MPNFYVMLYLRVKVSNVLCMLVLGKFFFLVCIP